MGKETSQRLIEPGVDIENPAQIGFEWFIDASKSSPGSGCGQGARILELSRLAGYDDPGPFGKALMAEERMIGFIQNAAIKAHRGVRGAPKITNRYDLSPEGVRGVIRRGFEVADELRVLQTEQLVEIWRDIVQDYSYIEMIDSREDIIRIRVNGLLREARERREEIAA